MLTALVTGGSRGIGRAIVEEFTRLKINTAFVYEKDDASARATTQNTGAFMIKSDLATSEGCEYAAGEAIRLLNHIDILVLNAGISLIKQVQDVTSSELNRLMEVNVNAPYRLTQLVVPQMIERKQGSIIFVSSMWGQIGGACESAYSMTKAALIGLNKALANELGPSGIRVNCVSPGLIDTDMNKNISKEDLNAFVYDTPLMKMGTPKDVSKAVAFLAGEDASFITGQVLGVNGGVC